MIGPFTTLSAILLVAGGMLVASGYVLGIPVIAVGAGWLGILFGTATRLIREHKEHRHG